MNWDHLVAMIALQIRQSLDLATILQTTADEVHQLLKCDRVLLYQFDPDWSGQVVVEAVADPQWSLLNRVVHDTCFESCWLESYQEKQIRAIADVAAANLTPCHAEFLTGFQVKANLVVPVLCTSQLWGLLIVHNCTAPRPWPDAEIAGVQQIAVHLGIAIHQAGLVAQLQAANADLEAQVATRTQELEQANQQLLAKVEECNEVAIALHQRETFLHQVLDSLFTFVWVLTPDGVLIESNQAPLDVAGITEDVIGKPFADAYWWCYSSEAQAQIREAIAQAQQGNSVRFDIPVQVRGGDRIIIDFSLNPLRDATGKITHLIPSGINITKRKQAEIALRQGRDERFQLAAIVESSQDAIISKTFDGMITSWNQAAERLFGYTASEVIGQYVTGMIPPERQSEAELILQRIHRGEWVDTYQTQRLHKDGSLVDVGLTISPIRDENGVVIGTSKIARDIRDRQRLEAERNQAELQLRQSNAQLEDFFDNASDLIQSVSLQDGRFLYVNRLWLTTLGYERDELAALTIFNLIAPECLPDYQRIFQELQSGAIDHVEPLEIAFVSKTGKKILLEGSLNVRCEAGIPIATRAILRDETAQRQVEKTLQEQTTILRIFYESSPLILGVVELSDNDILHTYHNPTNLKFFGVSPEALDHKWASEIGVPPEHIQLWLFHYHQSQEMQKPVQFEYEHETEAQTYWLLAAVQFIGIANSGRSQFSYTVQDITERKQLEIEHQRAEAMQRQAEQVSHELKLLENILDIILAGYWDWDIQENQEYLSPGFKRMFGYDAHELPNSPQTWQKLIFPEDLTRVLACFEQHIQSRGQIPYYNEVRYRHKDGSTVWVMCSGQVIEWDNEGNPMRIIGCHIDITDRKQSENNLRHINLVLENAVEGIARLDTTGRYISVNRAYAEICSYERDELIGQGWKVTVYPEDLPALESAYETMLQTGKVNVEARGVRQDGSLFYKQVIMITDHDDQGAFIGHYCLMKDISDRKQAELALQQSESRYRNIIETTLEGVWMLDADGKTTFVNQRMATMLGYTESEMKDTTLIDFIAPGDLPQAQSYLQRRREGIEEQHSFKFKRQDGTDLWAIISATLLLDDHGKFMGITGLLTDITELVTVQDALKTSKMQLSSVLNSSLDGIMAFRALRDDQGMIIDFEWLLSNPTAYSLVGRQVDDLIGKRLLQELPGNRDEGLFDLYVHVVKTGEPIQREFYYNQDGLESWFENIAVKLGDGFAVTFRDVTLIKKSELALKLVNQQLKERVADLDQRHAEMLILSEISDFLQACLTVAEACAALSSLVESLFPGCTGGVFVTNPSRNRLEMLSSWGDSLQSAPDFHPKDCWALRRGRLHTCDHHRSGLRCQHIPANEAIAITLCIPMIAQGETLGLFYLSTDTPTALPDAKRQMARTVAEQVALAIANLNLRETLQHQSIRDPLTGLFNRRYLEEVLKQEIDRAQRKQHSIGVVMIDVDHFKRFNDTYGHDAGDYVLQTIGALLKERVRGSDIACRYGGEEMTLVLPESSLEETTIKAEAIREAIAKLTLAYNGKHLGNLTISLGIAGFPKHGTTGIALIQAADAALYRAKAAGRNQVVVAP
ncbi:MULTISPECIES: PAS domain S-box protein [unclassified Nodularia (in: cyanobacteria)]|uniref:PAS domain S-box protein n=1 Tax=unclassified Nodularia (in: cyanobacteria) TaxID=2656917 RepID=UPI0018817E26|nr:MULTISPECIES: PAS domain S-box protein [unclassified Nodularia (in: cyanobacteria)]MBE9200737.1 PAS domain S-box protein [Nodularia sp. LEGE 06071]MCC2692057.1 PAS domain S-box protein [Nodularia sp. LEGE 04288]